MDVIAWKGDFKILNFATKRRGLLHGYLYFKACLKLVFYSKTHVRNLRESTVYIIFWFLVIFVDINLMSLYNIYDFTCPLA